MMSYLSVEWRKTQKFSMLMIGIFFLAFCSLHLCSHDVRKRV